MSNRYSVKDMLLIEQYLGHSEPMTIYDLCPTEMSYITDLFITKCTEEADPSLCKKINFFIKTSCMDVFKARTTCLVDLNIIAQASAKLKGDTAKAKNIKSLLESILGSIKKLDGKFKKLTSKEYIDELINSEWKNVPDDIVDTTCGLVSYSGENGSKYIRSCSALVHHTSMLQVSYKNLTSFAISKYKEIMP